MLNSRIDHEIATYKYGNTWYETTWRQKLICRASTIFSWGIITRQENTMQHKNQHKGSPIRSKTTTHCFCTFVQIPIYYNSSRKLNVKMHTNDFVSSKQHISMIYSNSRDANGNIMIILSILIGKLHLCMNRCVFIVRLVCGCTNQMILKLNRFMIYLTWWYVFVT